MVTLFTIGQVARHTGLTPKAIRLYEQRGLIRTAPRSPGGYRLYTENDVSTMAFIGRARSIGLPLGDIERIIAIQDGSGSPCGPVRDMLTRHIQDIDTAIAHLEDLRSALTATRDSEPAGGEPSEGCPIVNAGHRRLAGIQGTPVRLGVFLTLAVNDALRPRHGTTGSGHQPSAPPTSDR